MFRPVIWANPPFIDPHERLQYLAKIAHEIIEKKYSGANRDFIIEDLGAQGGNALSWMMDTLSASLKKNCGVEAQCFIQGIRVRQQNL